MTDDIDVIDQLRRWADHLEARAEAPIITTPPVPSSPPRHGRRAILLVTAAAVVALVLAFVVRDAAAPSPTDDTAAPTTTSRTTDDQQLPLAGTRWSTQRDAATRVVFELQQVRDGRGLLVGIISDDACASTLDGTARIDGNRLRFDDVAVDEGCPGAKDVATQLATVTIWNYGELDDELFLRNVDGEPVLRARGCGDESCGVDTRADAVIDRERPDLPLEGAGWRLDFRNSGLISAVAYQDDYAYVAAVLFSEGRVQASAGVAGGCMSVEANYTLNDDVVTIGDFTGTTTDCGPSIARLVERLTGEHPFTITGNVLTFADLQFIGQVIPP